ncbi:hypothetical protein GBA52_018083 [Prunus armeniaca]|nr:hypothetical protein GBA52_018083 [Prunus armeniaca]
MRLHSGCTGWHNRVLSVDVAEDGTVGHKGRRRVHSFRSQKEIWADCQSASHRQHQSIRAKSE